MAVVLVPIPITDSMFLAGSVPAVDVEAGEVGWVSGQTVAVGNERVYGKRVWKCAVVPADPAVPPDRDPKAWENMRPCNRWAPFDEYIQTASVGRKASIKYVLLARFPNGLSLHGFKGRRLKVTIKDASNGDLLIPATDRVLRASRPSFWQYLYGRKTPVASHRVEDIPLRPRVEITIEVTANADETVGLGYAAIGSWVVLGVEAGKPGTLYGARSEAVNYTFRKEFEDGTYRQEPRGSAVNLTLPVAIKAGDANRVWSVIQQLKDTPVPVYASKLDRLRYLSTVGFVSTDLSPDSLYVSKANLYVKGVLQ